MRRSIHAFAIAMGFLAVSPAAFADLTGDVNVISTWVRKPGRYSDDQNPERGKVTVVDPYRLSKKLETRTLLDIQYGQRKIYRGLPLSQVVRRGLSGGKDRVLLYFANGMRIPLQLADLNTLNAFLAVEVCEDRPRTCTVAFPEAPRLDVYTIDEDPRPITFSWNKLVVGKAWHPVTRQVESSSFSPWRHADTLIGMEFVDGAAYDAQFAVGSSGGEAVFLKRCQFCHSARYVGASFGWDFVTPLPLYEKRDPANLLNHVKYPKAMAQKLGLQMPPQKDVGKDEMNILWDWMRDVAQKKVAPYKP